MYRAKGRVMADKEKLRKALLKRNTNMHKVSIDNYYSRSWLGTMVSRGYVSQTAMEVLKKYGITEEEIRP